MNTITDILFNQGLFTSKLKAPQVADLTSFLHDELELEVVQDLQTIHDGTGLPAGVVQVPVWGYRGHNIAFSSPGPVLLAKKDRHIEVTWKNSLPTKRSNGQSIFPFKFNPPLAPKTSNEFRDKKADIITHAHGAVVMSGSDGWPIERHGPGYERMHRYTNHQPAATIWYHDHAMDQTGLNVYAGLAGGFVIIDHIDQTLSLYLKALGGNGPGWAEGIGHGVAGIPLVIQDRLLSDDGLQYVYQTNYDDTTPNPNGIMLGTGGEYFGVVNIVNGQVWPKLEVGPTAQRLKLLNGCNSRFLMLCFTDDNDNKLNVPVYHIGDDHGRRDTLSVLTGQIIRLGPGERLDVIVDFSTFAGKQVRLMDAGAAPFSGALPVITDLATKRNNANGRTSEATSASGSDNFPEVMLFDIAAVTAGVPVDPHAINLILATGGAHLPTPHITKTRVVALRELVMYMESPGMTEYVERCSTDNFNNNSVHMPYAMLVLEELAPWHPGDPVAYQSQFDLFDPSNPPGQYQYTVRGNTAGTLDAGYNGGVLRYQNDNNAWLKDTFNVKSGSTEVWRFVNLTVDTHPMHMHLVGFHVLSSCDISYDEKDVNGKVTGVIFNIQAGPLTTPTADHLLGFKDTVQVDPRTVLSVVATFQGGIGRYVYHCHMLEHEDHMMMRKIKVVL